MIDTHCHIDLYPDPHQLVREVERLNVVTVAVTNLPSHYVQGLPHLKGSKTIRQALGLHPLMVDQHTERELATFKQLADTTSYIGEVGLDFSRHGLATAKQQQQSFEFVLSTICDRPRFVTIHTRGAEEQVLKYLEQYQIRNVVFHWYSGPIKLVHSICEAQHYFSVNPAMVQSAKGRRIIEQISPDRVLTETDGPYVQTNDRPAKPSDVKLVLEHLASIWGVSFEEAEQKVWVNFQSVLSPIKKWQNA